MIGLFEWIRKDKLLNLVMIIFGSVMVASYVGLGMLKIAETDLFVFFSSLFFLAYLLWYLNKEFEKVRK